RVLTYDHDCSSRMISRYVIVHPNIWIPSINHFFFFFSSRRRHTRSKRDWSSDVCSSDLIPSTSVRRISTGNSANVKRYGTGSSWLFWYMGIPPRVTSVRCNNKNPYVGISDGWNYRSHFADVTAAHRI